MRRSSEHEEQALFIQEVKIRVIRKFPEVEGLYAIPNQGGSGFNGLRRGMQIKREGGKAGVSDLCLPVPRLRERVKRDRLCLAGTSAWVREDEKFPCFMGLYIEMKEAPKVSPVRKSISYSRPDTDQQKFIDFVRAQGYVAECANGMDEALKVLLWYLNLGKINSVALKVDYCHVETIRGKS